MMTPSQRRRRRGRLPAGAFGLIASVLFHTGAVVLLWAYLAVRSRLFPEERPPRLEEVSLRPISPQDWDANLGASAPSEHSHLASKEPAQTSPPHPEKPQPPEKKPEEPKPKGQVVAVAPGNGQEDPNAKYLSESSNAVKHETRSKNVTPFYRNAMPHPTTPVAHSGNGRDAVERAQKGGNLGLANDDAPKSEAAKRKGAFEVPSTKPRDEIKLETKPGEGPGPIVANRGESQEVTGNSNRLHILPGEAGSEQDKSGSLGREGAPGAVNLTPSISILDKIAGAAPNDHLDDVDVGEGTFLNTREWKFASFFNRVKQSVGMTWDPMVELRRRDPSGEIYGSRDRDTVVQVTLDQKGYLKGIYVEKSSGVDFLDLEAVRSFERAQPFPNPPQGLLSSDSMVHFSFGFYVEMSGPGLNLFRGAN